MDINCWIFLAAGILVVAWTATAGRYLQQNKPVPGWLAPNWIFGDPTCDPTTAPLTMPARCAIWFGAFVGAFFAFLVFGLAFKPTLDLEKLEDLIPIAFAGGIAALCGWWGYRGANAATRYVMVRRATPFEVFIAGAAGAVVSVWFHSGAGSGSSSSSSSSSSDSDRSSGGGSFGGGGASGSW